MKIKLECSINIDRFTYAMEIGGKKANRENSVELPRKLS